MEWLRDGAGESTWRNLRVKPLHDVLRALQERELARCDRGRQLVRILESFEKELALARHRLLMSLATTDWRGFQTESLNLENALQVSAPDDACRLEVSRRLATDRLLAAAHFGVRWSIVEELWAERERRGYSSLLDQQEVLSALVSAVLRAGDGVVLVRSELARFAEQLRVGEIPEGPLHRFLASAQRDLDAHSLGPNTLN